MYFVYCHIESVSGINWTELNIYLIELKGNQKHNSILSQCDVSPPPLHSIFRINCMLKQTFFFVPNNYLTKLYFSLNRTEIDLNLLRWARKQLKNIFNIDSVWCAPSPTTFIFRKYLASTNIFLLVLIRSF